MRFSLPPVDELVAAVDASDLDELERVGMAVAMADDLGSLGDEVVDHFVTAARQAGCSWAQIGGRLGVSKQAAQQAFTSTGRRRGRFGRRHARWSDEAGLVLKAAVGEARALGHRQVGTDHLLLALVAGDGVAAEALARLGAGHATVQGHVKDIVGLGDTKDSAHRPFTPRAKTVLELAARECLRLKHDRVRTEHLLLAVAQEGEGVAAQVLVQRLGIELSQVTRTVLDLVNQAGEPRTPGGRPTG
jgi:hypothetical protein